MAQIEESVARYLHQLDSADRQEPSLARTTKSTRLKEKLAKLEEEMQRLKAVDVQMLVNSKLTICCVRVFNPRDMSYESDMAWRGEAMVAARRIIALSADADQRRALVEISRSRTEPANRV